MPLPAMFYRHVLMWSLPNGEVAHCGIHWGGDTMALPDMVADNTTLTNKGLALWNAIKVYYSPTISYLGDKLYAIGADGLAFDSIDNLITPQPGVGTSVPLPHEVAVCVSIKTVGVGRRRRGRFYLPPPDNSRLTVHGRWVPAFQSGLVTALEDYLDAHTNGVHTISSSILSKADQLLRPVVEVSVGDVPDSQRRRRDALQEVRVKAQVTPSG